MPEARKAKLAELDGDLAEAESLIRRMDLEARTQPPEAKGRLLARLRDYKVSTRSRVLRLVECRSVLKSRAGTHEGLRSPYALSRRR